MSYSQELEVTVWRDGKKYRQKYSRGNPMTTLMCHELPVESKDRKGTCIRFWPDKEGILWLFKSIYGCYFRLHSLDKIALPLHSVRNIFSWCLTGLDCTFHFEFSFCFLFLVLNVGFIFIHKFWKSIFCLFISNFSYSIHNCDWVWLQHNRWTS